MTLVDTNVILDLVTGDNRWARWSLLQLKIAALAGPLAINNIVYAELSVRYDSAEDLDGVLLTLDLRLEAVSRTGLFLAGKAFRRYRSQGGSRTGMLPDFFIGAHAAAKNWPLLTRDAGRYRHYFPIIRLILPE